MARSCRRLWSRTGRSTRGRIFLVYIFPVLLVNVAVALVLSLAETPGTPARPVTGAAAASPAANPTTGAGAAATGQSIQQTHARLDELWKRRDDAAALAEQK